jgi:hypothetical protein
VIFQELLADLTREVVAATLGFDDGSGAVQNFPGLDLLFWRDCAASSGVDPCRSADGSLVEEGFGLDLTATAALFLNDAFFPAPLTPFFLEGDAFALASVDIVFVPEPGAGLLVAAGTLVLGALGRRRMRGL